MHRVLPVVSAMLLFMTACRSTTSTVDGPDEIFSPSSNPPLNISQMLRVYAELTDAELDIGPGVLQATGHTPSHVTPEMTRGQMIEHIDSLFLQMGVVVTHPDAKHVAFRLKR